MSLLSRHTGRHCRRGSLTGWAALAVLVEALKTPADPLGLWPPNVQRLPVIAPLSADYDLDPLERAS